LPANGLIYNSPNPCECYVESKLNGFNALAPSSKSVHLADADRLKTGPALGKVAPSSAAADDWPAFRHDTRRSGSAGTLLSAKFSKAWALDLGGVPTATVIANDLVHVAVPETRRLIAVDTAGGKMTWRVTTAGQVDTPPTWHRGTVVYGTSDGYVACRRASDGVLVWRFLAAPSHRRVMAGGRVESSWPVHGSVVVEGNRVYVVAGRSSFLDGGFSGWVLDAGTGKVIEQVRLDADSDAPSEGKVSSREGPGMTTDLLVGDGASLYLRGRTVFADVSMEEKTPLLRPVAGFLSGTWFNRVSHWKYGQASCGEAAITTDNLVFSFSAYPKRGTDTGFFRPGTASYELSAGTVVEKDVIDRKGNNRGVQELLQPEWTQKIPAAARAMLHAGRVVIVGGSLDAVDKEDPWKLIEGRGRGLLVVVSATDGELVAKFPLESPPVLDGMSAAGGRLFVASQAGELICLE
jgi:outer membrane protein assembly factor BamB